MWIQEKKKYMTLVNDFYDLVTHFYEYGWGQSFHFAPRHKWESFEASIARHEFYLALKLKLGPNMRVLDVGCGVGGPARAIARFSNATVVGVNNNKYQLERCRVLTAEQKLKNLEWMQGDFLKIPSGDNSFDAGFNCEAICHAPEKTLVYNELFRVLKPGSLFASLEWVMTEKYDANNSSHNAVKHGIEKGNGLPNLEKKEDILRQFKQAGFEIVEEEDLTHRADKDTPWYKSLTPSWSLTGFRHTPLGIFCTHAMVSALECLRVAPKGTTATSTMLIKTAKCLVEGGRTGIFTPMYFVLVRKPVEGGKKTN